MRIDSLKRAPAAPVRFARSEPARSTRWSLAHVRARAPRARAGRAGAAAAMARKRARSRA